MQDTKILEQVGRFLTGRHETIAVAESVTSGQLQAVFSLAPNSSLFFQGGITAYNIQQKYKHLHIDPSEALKCNCVSGEIAREMAINVGKLFVSDWSIGVTGYAAPMPEVGLTDLFAFYAIAHKNVIAKSGIIQADKPGIAEVQQFYVEQILKELYQLSKTVEYV
ncbi:MAG: nicotinamide-nucleotide amidohydrolase family protein [Ferruginibacter sp.]